MNRLKKDKQGKPLLKLKTPQENMQNFFSVRKSEMQSINELPLNKTRSFNMYRQEEFQWGSIAQFGNDEQEQEIEHEDHPNHQHSGLKPVKKFKDMDIIEKLNYLKTYPKHMPPVVCEYVTTERSYRGYFKQLENDELIILQLDQKPQMIQSDKILRINMLGFR